MISPAVKAMPANCDVGWHVTTQMTMRGNQLLWRDPANVQ